MSIRTERVAGEVQQAIARLFQTEFTDLSDGMITVTKVRMAPDLKSGRVYLSILGGLISGPDVLKSIKDASPQIRYGLSKALKMKFSPELFYYLDDTQEEVTRVEDIFKRIREEDAARNPHKALDESEFIASSEFNPPDEADKN